MRNLICEAKVSRKGFAAKFKKSLVEIEMLRSYMAVSWSVTHGVTVVIEIMALFWIVKTR